MSSVKAQSDEDKVIAQLRSQFYEERPIALELFSGIGGLSLGLELAGFFVAAHAEVEEETARYASYNFPLSRTLGGVSGDVRLLRGEDLLVGLGEREVTLIAGGPPCQGFSTIGRRRLNDDPLNDLVLDMARLTLEVRPKAFLIENVPGIKYGEVRQLDRALENLGKFYAISAPQTLLAADFGVPQLRRRVFVLGIRNDLNVAPSLPNATHMRSHVIPQLFETMPSTPTVREALSDLPVVDDYEHLLNDDEVRYSSSPHTEYQRLMRIQSLLALRRGYSVDWDESLCSNSRRTRHGLDLQARLASLGPAEADPSSRIRRLDPNGLSPTIRAGTTATRGAWSAPRPCHYEQPRVLTTRECARLQSFPDWFRFHPTKWHGNRQVGNAVPPLLAAGVGGHLLSLLNLRRTEDAPPPFIRRDVRLIETDIADARNANYTIESASHQVQGTDRESRRRKKVI